jgi:hypothetical protein
MEADRLRRQAAGLGPSPTFTASLLSGQGGLQEFEHRSRCKVKLRCIIAVLPRAGRDEAEVLRLAASLERGGQR